MPVWSSKRWALVFQLFWFLSYVEASILGEEYTSDARREGKDDASSAARSFWHQLERFARNGGKLGDDVGEQGDREVWTRLAANLFASHPHEDASGALAWLHLFGVPGAFPRDIDMAVTVAREGATMTSCGRCYTLLGLLLGQGYPQAVNVAHVTVPQAGRADPRPSLVFVGGAFGTAPPAGSAEAARLPRDVGPTDPSATAYVLAAHSRDALGVLATTYLSRLGLINATTLHAPGPNRASAVIPRKQMIDATVAAKSCDPLLTALLGELAGVAVDASDESAAAGDGEASVSPWDGVPQPLAVQEAVSDDGAWLQHVITDPSQVAPGELARAADKLEELKARRASNVDGNASYLRELAAARGHSGAALHVAVEHLKRREVAQARPFLEQVANRQGDVEEADVEMAGYYLRRYAAETPDSNEAWQHLHRAADLGREDAALLVAHAHAESNDSANTSEAIRLYRRIAEGTTNGDQEGVLQTRGRATGTLSEVQAFAAYNLGVLRLQDQASSKSARDPGRESKMQQDENRTHENRTGGDENRTGNKTSNNTNCSSPSEPSCSAFSTSPSPSATPETIAANSTTTTNDSSQPTTTTTTTTTFSAIAVDEHKAKLEGNDTTFIEEGCTPDAQIAFESVALSRLPILRVCLSLVRIFWRLGDHTGALLLSALLSDVGHSVGHADAAFVWEAWARHRPKHLGARRKEETGHTKAGKICNLTGWWTTSSLALAAQNVSRVFVAAVPGGGFEMFNASLGHGAALQGLQSVEEVVVPKPERSAFRHLHSFLWHTTYDAISGGAPVPVALQPPGAVPHLVETHHQRGKLLVGETCDSVRVEGMWVNWTFHRLGASSSSSNTEEDDTPSRDSKECGFFSSSCSHDSASLGRSDFLHCWVRPEWYFATLEANLAAAPPAPPPTIGDSSWASLVALTTSNDCPCRGAFGCRRADGACVAVSVPGGQSCPIGAELCPEVNPAMEPAGKPAFAAEPEVCAFFYHRRAAVAGNIDAMHVLSHAFSNGVWGATRDAAEAFVWSRRAMEAGDDRGRFDVAYSLEFGLGVPADPVKAYAMYQDLLNSKRGVPAAAKASSFLALLSASGRYIAGRLLESAASMWGGKMEGTTGASNVPPWSASPA